MAFQVVNPVAQSFYIDRPCVVTKVDLYFASKDGDGIPVRVHLRKNSGGFPSRYVVPFSDTMVYPTDIDISTDATTATTVTFQSPIFLDIGEYSLCLGSASNKYNVYVAELDGVDDATGTRISEDPFVGTLFKSQNASEWEQVLTEDLKFTLYRAKFDIGGATVDFRIPADNVGAPGSLGTPLLPKDPLEVYPGNTTMRIYQPNHGMSVGSYTVLSNINGGPDMGGNTQIIYGIDMSTVEGVGFPVTNATTDTYTITLPTAPNNDITTTTRFGGSAVAASRNFVYDAIYPVTASISTSNTDVARSFRRTSTSHVIDSTFTDLVDDDNELTSPGMIAGSATAYYNLANNDSFVYRLTLSSADPYSTPIIDVNQVGVFAIKNLVNNPTYASENYLDQDKVTFMSANTITVTNSNNEFGIVSVPTGLQQDAQALTVGTLMVVTGTNQNNGTFRITNVAANGYQMTLANIAGTNFVSESNTYTMVNGRRYVADEAATGSTSYSQYITRQVDFVNPSTSFNMRVDVNTPSGSNLKFFYKTKLVGETTDLATKEYKEITGITLPTSLTADFTEIEKQVNDLEPFESIVFKIVFLSSNSVNIPKCRNFRAIALA